MQMLGFCLIAYIDNIDRRHNYRVEWNFLIAAVRLNVKRCFITLIVLKCDKSSNYANLDERNVSSKVFIRWKNMFWLCKRKKNEYFLCLHRRFPILIYHVAKRSSCEIIQNIFEIERFDKCLSRALKKRFIL